MGAIADLAVPQGGAIAALPNPAEDVGSEQLDIQNTQAVSGPFKQGLRSGINSLGANIHALIGQTGEAMGLTDFAADRFKDAEEYAHFSDAVAPIVRDPGQVKDFTSLVHYVAGQTGEGIASSLPALAAGMALRRPVAGAFAGMLPTEIGSHVRDLRADPKVMETHTPGELLGNAAASGAATSALYAAVGAPAQAVGKVVKPALTSAAESLGKATAGQALASGGASAITQAAHQQANPETKMDWNEALKAAIGGAVGGFAIGGMGHAAGFLPGAAAKTAAELKSRLTKKKGPEDINADPDIKDIPENATVDDVAKMIDEKFNAGKDALQGVWNKVKDHPAAKRFQDEEGNLDPSKFNDEVQRVKGEYETSEAKKRVDSALETGKTYLGGLKQWLKSKGTGADEAKKSEMRTTVDDDILDSTIAAMDPKDQAAASTEQLKELGHIIKQMASDPEYFAETGVPVGLKKAFGTRFEALMQNAVERIHAPGPARKAALEAIKGVFKQKKIAEDERMDEVKSLIRNKMRSEHLVKPEHRAEAVNEFAPQLLDYVEHEGEKTHGFHEMMHEVFGDNTDDAYTQLDRLRTKRTTISTEALDTTTPEDNTPKVSDDAHVVEKEWNPAVNPADDKILNKEYRTPKEATDASDALYAKYGRRNINVNHTVDPETGHVTLSIEAPDEVGLSKDEFQGVREGAQNKSTLKEGVITVRTDDHPSGVKVNMVKLTSAMIRREGGYLPDNAPKYIADMVKRGFASIMASEGFKNFQVSAEKYDLSNLPDDARVAYFKGKTWTWGEIKDAGKLSKMDLANITKEDVIAQYEKLQETAAGKKATHEQLRAQAVKQAIERSRDKAMRETLADRMDRQMEPGPIEKRVGGEKDSDEGFRTQWRGKFEEDKLNDNSRQTDLSREKQYDEEGAGARKFEEDTGRPIGEGTAPKLAAEVAPDTKAAPHGKGTISPEGYLAAKQTREIQSALNSANPKVQEARKALTKGMREIAPKKDPGTKYSLMTPEGDHAFDSMSDAEIEKYHEDLRKAMGPRGNETTDKYLARIKADMDAHPGDAPYYGKVLALMHDPRVDKNEIFGSKEAADAVTKMLEKGVKNSDAASEAVSKLFGAYSTMNVKKGPQTKQMRQEVRDYVTKVLGDEASVRFLKGMDHAGEFAKLDGVESLKISADASDPMSVGYHEAAHALMARLVAADPKAAHTLLRAAGAAPIVARLRELLKDHPRALEQLKDPEERLAYMYQFWASGHKGLLSIGPNTRTFFEKVKDFFAKIGNVWMDQSGSLAATEKANQLLLAFHDGRFADRNTVAEVLKDRFPVDPEEKLRSMWPGLGKVMDKFIYTAGSAVRDMNIPEFTDVIDKFHTIIGERNKEAGFNQVKHVMYDQYMNKVFAITEGMNLEQQRQLLEEMQSGEKRTSPAAKKLEALNKELYSYMKDKGVMTFDPKKPMEYLPLKEVKENYWHRVPNQDYLRTAEGKEAFIKMLSKHGVESPEAIHDLWTRDIDSGKPQEGDAVLGLSFFTPQINQRKLTNIPNKDMAPFLNKDLQGTMSQYIQRAVRRAEYTERFGNRGEVIEAARAKALKSGATPAQMDVFNSSVQAHEGSLGAHLNPQVKNLYGGLMTYQNIRLLPLQIFSSFVDPGGIAIRGGTLGDAVGAMARGFRELVSKNHDDAERLAVTVGAISASHDINVANAMASAQYLPPMTRQISNWFFKYNGMESWNRSMRIAAAQAAHDFILRHVQEPTEHSTRYLEQLNLKAKDVKVHNGKLDVEDARISSAINRFVDESVLRPTASHRPIYMSDPHFMLVSHLKQYSYLFQKVILSRVADEAKHGNYSPAFALAGYVPMMIAADMARIMVTPGSADDTVRKGWTATDWLWSGIQRAGIFGPGQLAVGSAVDARQGRMFGQSVAGPTVEQLLNFVKAGAQGTGIGNQMIDAIPGVRMFKGSQPGSSGPTGDE